MNQKERDAVRERVTREAEKEVQEILSGQKTIIFLDAQTHTKDLLQIHLSFVVPLMILDLERQGGITDWHLEKIRAHGELIGSKGEAILYYVKGETARTIHALSECLAILAFAPGGVTFAELHFEGKPAYGRYDL